MEMIPVESNVALYTQLTFSEVLHSSFLQARRIYGKILAIDGVPISW